MAVQYKKYRKTYESKMKTALLFLEDEWEKTFISLYKAIEKMPNGYEKLYMALSDGKVIGFVYGYVLPNKMLIPMFLHVDKEYRNQGIATNLLDLLEKESKCVCSLIWYDKSLHNFYEKQNYDAGGNLEVAVKLLETK